MNYRPLVWDADALALNVGARSPDFGVSGRSRQRRLSFRLLRYWFMDRLLREEAVRLGRRLRVLEVGLHQGQMKAFVDGVPDAVKPYCAWDGVDCALDYPRLDSLRYGRLFETDLEDRDACDRLVAAARGVRYDVVILLHVLEHLHVPERTVVDLAPLVAHGGVMIGGFPVMPELLRQWREARLRRTARPRGHVSAFSPVRLTNLAAHAGARLEFSSGAFGIRASGSSLEDSPAWLRLNLLFGALVPWWPGELYWKIRMAQASGTA